MVLLSVLKQLKTNRHYDFGVITLPQQSPNPPLNLGSGGQWHRGVQFEGLLREAEIAGLGICTSCLRWYLDATLCFRMTIMFFIPIMLEWVPPFSLHSFFLFCFVFNSSTVSVAVLSMLVFRRTKPFSILTTSFNLFHSQLPPPNPLLCGQGSVVCV